MFDTAEPIPEKKPIQDSLKVAPLAPAKNKKKQPSIYKKQATSPLNQIPSPKNDISGEQVRDVFYKEKDIDRIVAYCEKDTVTVAQIILKLRNQDLLNASEVLSV